MLVEALSNRGWFDQLKLIHGTVSVTRVLVSAPIGIGNGKKRRSDTTRDLRLPMTYSDIISATPVPLPSGLNMSDSKDYQRV